MAWQGRKDEVDLRYGFFGWKPRWLQVLNRSGCYVLFMFLSNVFMSMTVNGFVGLVISNLETRFELSSNQSSWIASAYELAAIPVMLFVSLFGHRSHRPKVTAIGLFLMVLGVMLFVVPHFTTGVYEPNSGRLDHGLCLTEENSFNGTIDRACRRKNQESGQLSKYLAVFVIARVFQGLGSVPIQTLAVTFLDDVVSKQDFALYVAIYFAGGVLGPAVGYIAGGFMLNLFTDFPTVDTSKLGINNSDPRWVGAWWLGFLIGGLCLFISSAPFFGYSNDLPGAAAIRATKETEAHGDNDPDKVKDNLADATCRELGEMTKTLIRNPSFIFLTLFCVSDAFAITGFSNYGPKYLENQFRVSSSFAGMLFGLVALPGGVGGTVCGGWIIKRFRLKVRGIMKLELVTTVILILAALCFFIICEPPDFAGVNTHYNGTKSGTFNLSSLCNNQCACENAAFNPVCGIDNVQYYSPCHAGCSALDQFPGKEFYNCSCIGSGTSTGKMADKSICRSSNCMLMPLFLAVFFVGMFIIFLNSGMNCTVTLRIVLPETRAFALGLQGIITRLAGTFPGPLVFGIAFDAACSLWQTTCTGGRGSCYMYDNNSMALYLFLVFVGIKLASMVFMVAALLLYKPPTVSKPSNNDQQVSYGTKGNDSPVFEANTVDVSSPYYVAYNVDKSKTTDNGFTRF